MKRTVAVLLCWSLWVAGPTLARSTAVEVEDIASYTDAELGLTVVGGQVSLPRTGLWGGDLASRGGVLEQLALLPVAEEPAMVTAGRVELARRESYVQRGSYHVRRWWSALSRYARENDGIGPASVDDLPENAQQFREYLVRSPWNEDRDVDLEGPVQFLVPHVPILEQPVTSEDVPVPLVLELRPYVDDGKHWVLLSDGTAERREVDPELLNRYGLALTFVTPNGPVSSEVSDDRTYKIYALWREPGELAAETFVRERSSGRKLAVSWDLATASAGERGVLTEWAKARFIEMAPHTRAADSTVILRWLVAASDLYGLGDSSVIELPWNRRGGPTASLFSVLGGRAAVRETLQLQRLRGMDRNGDEGEEIPVEDLEGVDAPSHPFAEMLGETRVRGLELADLTPHDRLFVYFARPEALESFLSKGTDFLFRGRSLFTGRSIVYDLKGRYYGKLGVDGEWIRRFLDSGAVAEMAVVLPDLHLMDGTDLTVICRVPRIERFAPLLKLLGIVDLREGTVTERETKAGRAAFWTRRGDLVFASTRRAELERILLLEDSGGAGSLGQSAEFRYMLHKVPITGATRVYTYFSDPFIRRLTGPALKIGQLRRLASRSALAQLTAGALLRRLDTGQEGAEYESLAALGYIPADLSEEFSLRGNGTAVSRTWGPLNDLDGLLAHPVTAVTKGEARAYGQYVQNYNRFWRRYFDPIAVRLDEADAEALELSTFILPLVDNTIYEAVRTSLDTAENGGPLRVPHLGGDAVLTLSLNVPESRWIKLAGDYGRRVTKFVALDPELFDLLGPGVHIAVMDGDPIVALGSGDVMGALGAEILTSRRTGLGIPLLLSVLTRPTRILLELSDEQAALEILRRAAARGGPGRPRDFRQANTSFRQMGDGDAWLCTYNLGGIISLRFGIEIQDGFLVVSNLPWSHPVHIESVGEAPLNGAFLRVRTEAVTEQLPALFTSASERYQEAALQGMGYLYPLLLTGEPNPAAAATRLKTLYGLYPVHPDGGEWTWEGGVLESTLYGTARTWKIPAYPEGSRDFGLLRNVEDLSVNMQMEEDGLRSSVKWRWVGE